MNADFPCVIFQLSFVIDWTVTQKMANEKWQLENGKSYFCDKVQAEPRNYVPSGLRAARQIWRHVKFLVDFFVERILTQCSIELLHLQRGFA
jgi:hypothetical protein